MIKRGAGGGGSRSVRLVRSGSWENRSTLWLALIRTGRRTGVISKLALRVKTCSETGGFIARWDDPQGGGITTQGDSLAELHAKVADAVKGDFEPGEYPRRVRLHFEDNPILAVA